MIFFFFSVCGLVEGAWNWLFRSQRSFFIRWLEISKIVISGQQTHLSWMVVIGGWIFSYRKSRWSNAITSNEFSRLANWRSSTWKGWCQRTSISVLSAFKDNDGILYRRVIVSRIFSLTRIALKMNDWRMLVFFKFFHQLWRRFIKKTLFKAQIRGNFMLN